MAGLFHSFCGTKMSLAGAERRGQGRRNRKSFLPAALRGDLDGLSSPRRGKLFDSEPRRAKWQDESGQRRNRRRYLPSNSRSSLGGSCCCPRISSCAEANPAGGEHGVISREAASSAGGSLRLARITPLGPGKALFSGQKGPGSSSGPRKCPLAGQPGSVG